MAIVSTQRGDATRPVGDGRKIICHVCNDVGAWGAGFVLALSKRWPEPEQSYRDWQAGKIKVPFELGTIQLVRVEDDIWVANMLAQRGTRAKAGVPPLRYDALERCLGAAANAAKELGATLHMPRVGCGRAGGDWSRVKQIIERAVREAGVRATVYEL